MSFAGSGIALPWRRVGTDWTLWQQSQTYDVLMRLPIALWGFCALLVVSIELMGYVQRAAGVTTGIFAINVVMRLATCGFLALITASAMVRMRPSAKARGVAPRVAALLGSFLFYTVALLPRHELSPALAIISTLLTLSGTLGAIAILTQLGRSFSVMAEARQLVTTGVYGFVRHPLYLAEEVAVIGFAMQFASYWTLLIVVGQIAFQLCRIRNEEAVLAETFPEYEVYRQHTARLIPGLY